ncbi:hypothetical protein MD484_g6654, partial [Candolleomyces efflorescens]
MVWRVLQAFGASPGLSVGAGVIGDIYRLEERGGAMGIFFAMAAGDSQSLEAIRPATESEFTFCGFLTLLTNFVLLVPIVYTIGKRYNITNEALIGACFLPAGMGNLIAAPLAGRISDLIVVRYRANRGGVWYPEDRIRGTLIGALIIVPVSIIGSGVVTTYIEDRSLGLTLNLVCLFFNGFGVDVVLSPCAAYIVDVMHSRSAEIMAANNATRSLLLAIFIAGIIPMIEKYGVLVTNTISGATSLIVFGLLWTTISYGEQLRSWKWGALRRSDEAEN